MSRPPLLAVSIFLACTGCYFPPDPQPVAMPSKYDQAFDAALAAAGDAGVEIKVADRATGRIVGAKANVEVTIRLQRQANGSVTVEFDAPGSTETNPKLGDQWLAAYQRRMGR